MNETIHNNGFEAEQSNNYKKEGDMFIKKLKDNVMYSYEFFYDTDETDAKGKKKKKACQIAPLRSKMIYDLCREYHIEINPEDFSTILYSALWDNGSWAILDSFEGRSSFFTWLKKVAKNIVVEWLEQEGLIDHAGSRTVGNTRLALLSKSPIECKMVIDNMMSGSKYHKLLIAIYVDRLPKERIMEEQEMSDAEYENAKKIGEKILKDTLLRSVDYCEEDVLRDKTKHVITVSAEFVADLADWCKTKTERSPLADVFGVNLSDEEIRVKTVEFLYDFSAKLGWSEQDRYIWRRRFIINADPVGLAQEIGRSRGWLDTRYSRLNKKFEKAIRKWWSSHAA